MAAAEEKIEQCAICCEDFNKKQNSEICCQNPDCNVSICKTCVRTYISEKVDEPHCMSCKQPYDPVFLMESVNKTYYKTTFKEQRKKAFIDFERSQFPNTQADVTKFLQIEKLENENAEFKLEILKLKSKLEHLRSAYYQNTLKIWDIRDGNDKKEKTEFIMKCQDENCNGYLSTSYKCGICDKKTCKKCLNCIGSSQEEHEAHVCKPEEVESANAIREETKPCPACATRIFKIEGCDQMFCTNCNKAFSWKTGQLVNGVIHNPHYYEYLQQQGQDGYVPRNVGDVPCGGLIPINDLNMITYRSKPFIDYFDKHYSFENLVKYKMMKYYIQTIHQFISDIIHVKLASVADTITRYNQTLLKNRILFMLNRLPEKKWTSSVFTNKQQLYRLNEERRLYEIVSSVGQDLINNFISLWEKSINESDDIESHLTYMYDQSRILMGEFINILNYFNHYQSRVSLSTGFVTSRIETRYILPEINKIKEFNKTMSNQKRPFTSHRMSLNAFVKNDPSFLRMFSCSNASEEQKKQYDEAVNQATPCISETQTSWIVDRFLYGSEKSK